MRRVVLAACAAAVVAGLYAAESARADERSPFQLLGTSQVAAVDGQAGASQVPVTPVRWGCGYGGYGYGGYYRPYTSYYRPYGGYYGGYGSYYRPYGGYYGGYGGYYGGYRPGFYFGF